MGMKAHWIILLALLAMPSLHAAAYNQVCAPDQLGANGGNGLLGITFMLVTVAIAGAYMYGKAMHSSEAEVWAKDEAGNLLISVLLFAGLAIVFGGACSLAEEYAGGSPFVASYQYLDRLVYNTAIPAVKNLVLQSLQEQKEATRYLYIGFIPFTGHGVASDANQRALSANKEFMIDLLLPMVASLSAQRQALQIIEIFASSMLLPFAFMLRIIPPMREIGNMLIALFFGIYIVAPTMYAMGGAAFEKVLDNPISHMTTCTVYSGFPPLPRQVPCPVHDFSDWSFDASTGRDAWLFRIGSVMPQAVFLPNLIIVVVTTCTMALAKGLRTIQV